MDNLNPRFLERMNQASALNCAIIFDSANGDLTGLDLVCLRGYFQNMTDSLTRSIDRIKQDGSEVSNG